MCDWVGEKDLSPELRRRLNVLERRQRLTALAVAVGALAMMAEALWTVLGHVR